MPVMDRDDRSERAKQCGRNIQKNRCRTTSRFSRETKDVKAKVNRRVPSVVIPLSVPDFSANCRLVLRRTRQVYRTLSPLSKWTRDLRRNI
jgi:hypothetical protein